MYPVNILQFGLSVETTLPRAVSFHRLNVDALGETLLGSFELQGLTSEGLVVRRHDALYDYHVNFALFGGSAKFAVAAKTVRADFVNGHTAADLNAMTDVLTRFHGCLNLAEGCSHIVSATVHFSFEEEGACARYFAPAEGSRWQGHRDAGVIVYLEVGGWRPLVRVSLERSLTVPDGGFLVLSTQTTSAGIDTVTGNQILDAYTQVAARCELEVRPLP